MILKQQNASNLSESKPLLQRIPSNMRLPLLIILIMVVLILVYSLGAASNGQNTSGNNSENTSASSISGTRRRVISGTLREVEEGKLNVETNRGETLEVALTDATRIDFRSNSETSELEAGQTVTIYTTADAERLTAERIRVR